MNRQELIKQTSELLRDNRVRKKVTLPQKRFYISDDSDASPKEFVVKSGEKTVPYTTDDIGTILNALLAVATSAVEGGDEVNVAAYFNLGLKYVKPRLMHDVRSGKNCMTRGSYIIRLKPGKWLLRAAKTYTVNHCEGYSGGIDAIAEEDFDEEEADA